MIDVIVSYLVRGVAPSEIASIVGCSDSYISQVKDRADYPELAEKAKLALKLSEAEVKREEGYSHLEDKLLGAIEEQMPFAEFSHLTSLLSTLIKRKQTTAATGGGMMVTNNDNRVQTIVLQMPSVAVPEIRMNSQREVVGIGQQSLTPMTSGGVRGIFAQIEEKKKQQEKIKREAMTIENDLEK